MTKKEKQRRQNLVNQIIYHAKSLGMHTDRFGNVVNDTHTVRIKQKAMVIRLETKTSGTWVRTMSRFYSDLTQEDVSLFCRMLTRRV